MKMRPRKRMIHTGEKGVYERTDPDYIDKRLAGLKRDYESLSPEWQGTFLKGLDKKDFDALIQMLNVNNR